jgi:Regulator of Chromosome Condensation (RCC1) repeat protein
MRIPIGFFLLTITASSQAQQAPAPTDTLASLSASEKSTCLTSAAGKGYCWGTSAARGTVVPVVGVDRRPLALRSLSPAWLESLCGLTPMGQIWCNPNSPGRFDSADARVAGRCATEVCLIPLRDRGQLPSGAVRALVRGFFHGCVIGPDAAAYCWGSNDHGQLGTGDWEANPPGRSAVMRGPAPVSGGLRFARLSAREYQTCGVTLGRGQLYCWGYGQSGQTGDSAVVADCLRPRKPNQPCSSLIPNRVLPESLPGSRVVPSQLQFVDVSAGGRLACAVSVEGAAYCWGDNYRCGLGRCEPGGSSRARLIPVPGRVVEVGAGYQFACARTADGRIFCWGDNSYGQLGSLVSINTGADGLPPDYRDSTAPGVWSAAYRDPCFGGGRCSPAAAEVGSGHRWSALSVGQEHACGLARDDDGIYCWGGTDPRVLGRDQFPITCVNRSFSRPNKRCQATPVRVPGLPSFASPPVSSPPSPSGALLVPSGRDPMSATEVEVSARRIRIAFPTDTTGAWGWPARREQNPLESYIWSAEVEGMDGPAMIELRVYQRDSTARRFSLLDQLVAAGRPGLCLPGMVQSCKPVKVTSRLEDHRLILTVENKTAIARLFGTRPPRVRVFRVTPDEEPSYRSDSVEVRYVDPQIPQPDSSTRAQAARGRRRYQASITSIGRTIEGGTGWGVEDLWLAVGDSLPLTVKETHCHYDSCFGSRAELGDSGWSVGDTSVVQIMSACRNGEMKRTLGDSCSIMARARRIGRTTISIRGLHGPSDTMPSRHPPERRVERTVIVGPPVARVVFVTRPDTVLLGEPVTFQVRALDRAGQVIPDVPVEVWTDVGSYTSAQSASQPWPVQFQAVGPRLVTASFRGLADTLVVRVVKGRKP